MSEIIIPPFSIVKNLDLSEFIDQKLCFMMNLKKNILNTIHRLDL